MRWAYKKGEIERLSARKDYSLSRAIEQAPYLCGPLVRRLPDVIRADLLEEELNKVPMVLVERDGQRHKITVDEVAESGFFWTVESPLTSSIEHLAREVPQDLSASLILRTLSRSGSDLPPDCVQS